MPWHETVSSALASKVGYPAFPQAASDSGWAGAPVPPQEADDGLTAFWTSPRFIDASQALTRWHRVELHDPAGNIVADISGPDAFGRLTDTMRSRPDVTVWVPTAESTCVAVTVLDPQAVLEAAKEGPPPTVEPDEPRKPAYVRPVLEARCTGLEIQPPLPPWREKLIAPGSGETLAEQGRRFLSPRPRRSVVWWAWRWPVGWEFKPGRRAAGLRVVASVPAEGTVITLDGVRYQASWSFSALGHELLPMPEWLCQLLGRET
jgi:hypothetical protein